MEFKKGDNILVRTATGREIIVTVRYVYDSGRLRVARKDGHIIIIEPEDILRNYGRFDN